MVLVQQQHPSIVLVLQGLWRHSYKGMVGAYRSSSDAAAMMTLSEHMVCQHRASHSKRVGRLGSTLSVTGVAPPELWIWSAKGRMVLGSVNLDTFIHGSRPTCTPRPSSAPRRKKKKEGKNVGRWRRAATSMGTSWDMLEFGEGLAFSLSLSWHPRALAQP